MASRYLPEMERQIQKPRSLSPKKYLQRRVIVAWKSFSQMARKQQRASILPEDFVLLTARRRSVRYN
ncbi:hypothetical protein WOLCODRAFT_166775 [Wolfiporia cocos MD-104 SS10]|uniref:Uncharacterized protein n=1 Tax=Wolfiporia cocos (strain MD-104) TaxID=742152 RepID=A0A2H3JBX9_WOLCO|nr:hypothetical protein WOLCODRAFT_166775 [Wolfiporia cocos MD-104 SS10]